MRRPIALAPLVVLGLFCMLPASVALADDTTAPEGTLVIEGGTDWVNHPDLDLDVTATDDVGVVSVRVRRQGGAWVDYAYSPHITFSLGAASSLEDTQYGLEVEWADAAGNRSGGFGIIGYDGTAPKLLDFQETTPEGPEGTVTFAFQVDESFNGTGKVRLSSNGGNTWGKVLALPGTQLLVWDPWDPDVGGSTKLGPRTVSAQVRDQAGNWSNVKSTNIELQVHLSLGASDHLATGHPVTFTPRWSAPVSFPAGTICRWSFAWGNDASLYHSDHDETYGLVQVGGSAGAGYCDEWRFTIPWTSVRQYLVEYVVVGKDGDVLADASIGGSPNAANLSVSVDSTSRDITSSNLPMLYVLPESWQLTVGVPATYNAHGVGGATVRSTDQWRVEITDNNDVYPGSASLTFTPTQPGHVTVCLYRPSLQGPLLGACYDPPVKRASGGSGASPLPEAPSPVATSGPSTGPVGSPVDSPMPSSALSTAPAASPTDAIGGGAGPTDGAAATNPPAVDPAAASSDARPVVLLAGLVTLLGAGAAGIAWRRGWRPSRARPDVTP